MTKICTSIEQSKKLLELGIDLTTADMFYRDNGVDVKLMWEHLPDVQVTNPAWSLTALLELIPPYLGEFNEGVDFGLSKAMNGKWYSAHYIQLNNDGMATFNKTVTGDTAIDAAFQMVVWLKENEKI